MDVLFSQKTAKQMTFEDKICFLLCTSPQEEQVNFRYNLNAFFPVYFSTTSAQLFITY